MLSERYRPTTWEGFVGQPAIAEIVTACADAHLFDGCGERWLFESDGHAGCGKTSAAYVTARALGVSDHAIERIDSRACTVDDLRALSGSMRYFGFGSDHGRRAYILDEIQHLSTACLRMLLGLLEDLPPHVIVIATTTSTTWADDVDGLYSRWRRFTFRKPNAGDVAALCETIARREGFAIPDGFRWLAYVQGKCGAKLVGNNVRDCIEQLPDALRRYKGSTAATATAAA